MPSLEEAMRQSEDGIEQLDDGLITPVNDMFMINPETRIIEVPETERLFGVNFDKDVEKKYFKCPKIVGNNIDLSKHKIYVVYQKANENITTLMGEVGKYWCEDIKVDETGDYIEFSWLLSGNVLEEQGFIAFKVVAVYTDTETGELKTRWNTVPSVGLVRFTLSDGEEITEQYADVISQLLQRMEQVEDIATPEAMKGYVEQYLNEHPMELDESLTDSKKAAPANLVGQLKKDTGEIGKVIEIGGEKTITTPQLADISTIKVGRPTFKYHQTKYNDDLSSEEYYRTLDAIEFTDESIKTLRLNFKPTSIICFRTQDGTAEGAVPIANVTDNDDNSFSFATTAANKAKWIRISWSNIQYPNLVPLVTNEDEWDANADKTFIGSKIIKLPTSLKDKVVNISNLGDDVIKLFNPEIINPCDYKGDEIRIFGKGLCIGDSLTYGQSDRNDTGSLGGFKHVGMNYPDNLMRLTGIDLTNAGTAGKTFQTWWELHKNDDFSGHDFCIIALGVNDAYFNKMWTEDSLTYLTSIVNAVRTANNHIPIFITTPPMYFLGYTGADFESVAEGIRNAATLLNLYLVDFRKYLTEFSRANAEKISVMAYGHFNAYGYYKIAVAYKSYISYIISQNMDDFRNVQFVGTNYSYSSN